MMIEKIIIGPVRYNGLYGYINPEGAFVIKPEFQELGIHSEGMISFKMGNRIGFLNMDGELVIPPRFELRQHLEIMPIFKNGLAAVSFNGRIGYIYKSGDWKIPPSWGWGWNFNGDYALVELEKGYFVIDRSGNIITRFNVYDIPSDPYWISDWECFRCLFKVGNRIYQGCININGKIVFPPKYYYLTNFYEGIAAFSESEDGDIYGLIELSGKIIKEPQFLFVSNFSEGLAAANRKFGNHIDGGIRGYINNLGEWVIEPRFSYAYDFSGGLACVGIGEKRNKYYEIINKPAFGFINRSGEFVIEPIYSSANHLSGGYVMVEKDNKSFIFDNNGKLIWEGAQ
ncbi:MAG TPA: WG repeat-containing protein [Verrucomicrobiota bacterium]|nr:WG repeat-containing protein [Verrucomicrobiota bacterium]